MAQKLVEGGGRLELLAIGEELRVAREHMRALLSRVKCTHGFRAVGADANASVTLQFIWGGNLEVALESVSAAIHELGQGARRRR
jgi:hypothetical protein